MKTTFYDTLHHQADLVIYLSKVIKKSFRILNSNEGSPCGGIGLVGGAAVILWRSAREHYNFQISIQLQFYVKYLYKKNRGRVTEAHQINFFSRIEL